MMGGLGECWLGYTPGSWWAEISISLKLLPTRTPQAEAGTSQGSPPSQGCCSSAAPSWRLNTQPNPLWTESKFLPSSWEGENQNQAPPPLWIFGNVWVSEHKQVCCDTSMCMGKQAEGRDMHTGGTHKTLKIRGYKCTAQSKVKWNVFRKS